MIDGKIHFLSEGDLLEAQKLILDHPETFSHTDVTWFRKDLKSAVLQPNVYEGELFALILKSKGEICGVLVYEKDAYSHNSYRIVWLLVKKGYENQGYGSLLVADACRRMREDGGRHIYVETSEERHNKKAKHFYKKVGFRKVGVLPDYFDPPISRYKRLEDALLYHKAL